MRDGDMMAASAVPAGGSGSTPRRVEAATDAEGVIRSFAAGYHGLVTRSQLIGAGVPAHVIDHRVKKGRLECLYRGVYRVGPLRARYEREAAAVLACGVGAVLSHRSVAVASELLPPFEGPVDVTVRHGYRAPGPDVRTHRTRRLDADETTTLEGIPVTTPGRTLLDLAGTVRERELEQALAIAERRGLVSRAELLALLAREPRRAGARALRALLAREGDLALTRSEAESRLLALLRRAQLEPPMTNAQVQGFEVDFLWRAARLVVEVDGFAWHGSARAFERDRRRDAVLTAAGFRVMRVTWRQLSREPQALLVRVAQALVAPTERRPESTGRW